MAIALLFKRKNKALLSPLVKHEVPEINYRCLTFKALHFQMLAVVQREKLLDLNLESGKVLLSGLKDLEGRFPGLVTSSRGIGTFCAVDSPTVETRFDLKTGVSRPEVGG